jgi:hypothetical protein
MRTADSTPSTLMRHDDNFTNEPDDRGCPVRDIGISFLKTLLIISLFSYRVVAFPCAANSVDHLALQLARSWRRTCRSLHITAKRCGQQAVDLSMPHSLYRQCCIICSLFGAEEREAKRLGMYVMRGMCQKEGRTIVSQVGLGRGR